MSDHVRYTRPVLVTEENLRDAITKQAKQKALKEALDKQIQETERIRADARIKKRSKSNGNYHHISNAETTQQAQKKPQQERVSLETAEPGKEGRMPSSFGVSCSPPGPSPPAPRVYTFTYEEGFGHFTHEGSEGRGAEGEHHLPRTGLSQGPVSKRSVEDSNALNPWRVPDQDDGDFGPTPPAPLLKHGVRTVVRPREEVKRKQGKDTEVGNRSNKTNALAPTPQHDSASLPLDFDIRMRHKSKRLPKVVRGKPGGLLPVGVSPVTHETQSLPVELSFRLGRDEVPAPLGALYGVPTGPDTPHNLTIAPRKRSPATGQCGGSGARSSHALELRTSTPMSNEQPPARGSRPQNAPSRDTMMHYLLKEATDNRHRRETGSSGSTSTSPRGPMHPHSRPTGGVLPPLEMQSIEMSGVLESSRQIEGSSAELLVASLPRSARNLQERERAWEDQVRQLKAGLRQTRRKDRAHGNNLAPIARRRAETAPDPPSHPPGCHQGRPRHTGEGGRQKYKAEDFSMARIFSPGTFRPITAPDPLEYDMGEIHARQCGESVGLSEASFKLASLTTQQNALGLPTEHASQPVPIQYVHLLQFAEAQIITQEQADGLWQFFSNRASQRNSLLASVELNTGCTSGATPVDEVPEITSARRARGDYHQAQLSPIDTVVTPVLAPALRRKIQGKQTCGEGIANRSPPECGDRETPESNSNSASLGQRTPRRSPQRSLTPLGSGG